MKKLKKLMKDLITRIVLNLKFLKKIHFMLGELIKENIVILFIKVNGKIKKEKVLVNKNLKMVLFIWECGMKIRPMEKEDLSMPMVTVIQANGTMIKPADKENIFIMMVLLIKDNGKMIVNMDKE